ncbi:MAG: tetratricopeptide repeat protein [Candidatus Omnitrophota bacterium]
MQKILSLVVFVVCIGVSFLNAVPSFEQGEKLFLENKPNEAVKYLETALEEDRNNEKVYLYLGIVYEQLEYYDKAIAIMQLGLKISKSNGDRLYFNIGNNYFAKGDYERAKEMYGHSISQNPGYAEAYLNRANSLMHMSLYREALTDYTYYLSLRPSAPQRDKIEQMINLLKHSIAEEERKKKEEEQRKFEEEKKRREEELRRQEEEKKRIAEEQRRKEEERKRQEEEKQRQEQLLKNVLESLKNVKTDTTNLSTGSENIQDYHEELDLKD